MNELDVLPKTCVQIYQLDTYHGSGVLIEINNVFYVISAAHVLNYDESKTIDIKNFSGTSEEYGKIEFGVLLGKHEDILKYDIAVIAVDVKHTFPYFPSIKLCEDIGFPGISLVFRGTQKSTALKPHSICPCKIDTCSNNEGIFCIEVPIGAYADMKGNTGASVMNGYSGSGVFIRETDDIYLVGISQNIDKDAFNGVNCRSISILKKYFLPDIEISEFRGGNTQLRLNVAEIKRNITKKMVEERKANNYGDIENLTRKMDAFIENWAPEDLDGFVNDILVWENIERTKIRNHSLYRDRIENAKAILASGNKNYQVGSIQQGNERFHKILDEFTKLLQEELDGTSIKSSSSVIAAGEVARLLADCTLNFKK